MLKLILASFLVLFPFQIQEKEFYVKKIFVVSEYNSRYIHTNANQLIPSERKINSKVIQCFIDRLRESGILEDVTTELIPLERKGEYELQITPTYKANLEDFVIRDIYLDKSLSINEEVFLNRLEKRKIKIGMPFQPYTEIEMGIVGVIESLGKRSAKDWKDFKDIWINVSLIDSTGVKITITSEKPTCDLTS